MQFGIKSKPNTGRDLIVEYNGTKYARFPVETEIVNIGDKLEDFLNKFGKGYIQDGDIFCISSKIISITEGFVIHRSTVKIGWLAKLIVKFVKKWPNDYGYSLPEKMQVAINLVGYPRMIMALIGGTLMKMIGKPGYFYKIAGNNINAIDGFIPTAQKPFNDYAFLPPTNADSIANQISEFVGAPSIIIDGNNVDNNIMGMSKSAKTIHSKEDYMQILRGNPQGQDDDGNITPIIIIRKQ